MLGKHCDFVFTSAASRGRRVVEQLLMGFSGTLQADGYEVYARHRTDHENINHALCWRYTRRFFLKAKPSHPKLVKQITGTIAVLYRIERQSRESGADNRQILKLRGRRSPRRVDKIFKWIDTQIQHVELTPIDRSWQRVELTTFILTIIWWTYCSVWLYILLHECLNKLLDDGNSYLPMTHCARPYNTQISFAATARFGRLHL